MSMYVNVLRHSLGTRLGILLTQPSVMYQESSRLQQYLHQYIVPTRRSFVTAHKKLLESNLVRKWVLSVSLNGLSTRNGKPPKINNRKKVKRNILNKLLLEKQKKFQQDVNSIQYAFRERKERLKVTERKLRAKGRMIMEDIKETKEKMRERMENVIERENVYTIPNLLCVTRIVFSPYLGYLIVTHNFELALGLMAVAGISDWIDGRIARNYKSQSSKLGSFLDPMADKVLIGTLFLTLTYVDLIPVALTGLIIARDVALVAAGFVIRYKSLPPPRTLSRYFDVTHATAQLAPTFISKVNTGVQLLLVGSTLAAPVFGFVDHPALVALCWFTGASTIAAAGSYLLSKETFKYLRQQK